MNEPPPKVNDADYMRPTSPPAPPYKYPAYRDQTNENVKAALESIRRVLGPEEPRKPNCPNCGAAIRMSPCCYCGTYVEIG